MKKYFSRLTIALVLALVAGLAFAAPALANPTYMSGAQLYLGITKELNMAAGTAVPNSTFTFEFTQMMMVEHPQGNRLMPREGEPSNTVPAQVTGMDGATRTITFPAAAPLPATSNINQVRFDLNDVVWPHAGNFFFMVTEHEGTNTAIAADPNQSMTYDDSAFLVIVSVGNFPAATPNLRITQVQAADFTPPVYVEGPGGGPGTWTPGHWVTDPNGKRRWIEGVYVPGPDGQPGTWTTLPSQIHFINDYVDNRVQTLTDPRLAITKAVVGDTSTHADLTTDFSFTATLTMPAQVVAAHFAEGNDFVLPTTITATVTNSAGVAVDPLRTVAFERTIAGAAPNQTITYTPEADFTLRDGQELRFPNNVPAGTTVSVTERALENWAVQSVRFVDDAAAPSAPRGDWGHASGGYNQPLTADTATLSPVGAVTSTGSAMDFGNRFFHSPITGLVIGSMPFMAALFGATVLLAMMVASRSRQRIEQMPLAY